MILAERSIVRLSLLITTTPVLYQKSVYVSLIYASVPSVYAKQSNQFTPEKFSKMWNIGLKTSQSTLKYTTHQCIRTMGILVKRFNIDRAQLWFKIICWDTENATSITWRSGSNLWEDLLVELYIPISWVPIFSSHVQMKLHNRQVTPFSLYITSWSTTFTLLRQS